MVNLFGAMKIPQIPPVVVAICKLPTNPARYFIRLEIGAEGERRSFNITKIDDENELQLFDVEEAKSFVQSQLPAVIRMAGGQVVFREDCEFQISREVLEPFIPRNAILGHPAESRGIEIPDLLSCDDASGD